MKFSLLAHVSRRGDVDVAAGEWVAGPNAPAVIEGLEIRGSTNPGVGLELQPQVATTPPRWLDWVSPGKFAGTRGRGLALAGIRVRLVGAEASRFVLSAEALFLGSAIQGKRGQEIELVGSPGGDPLVGLRLDVVAAAEDGVLAKATNVQQRPESRVRVFRATSRIDFVSLDLGNGEVIHMGTYNLNWNTLQSLLVQGVDTATQASVNAALSQLGTLPIDDHTPTAPLVLPATVGGEGSFTTPNNSLFLYYGAGKDPSVTTTGNTVLSTGVAGGQIIDTNTGALGDILIADGSIVAPVHHGQQHPSRRLGSRYALWRIGQ